MNEWLIFDVNQPKDQKIKIQMDEKTLKDLIWNENIIWKEIRVTIMKKIRKKVILHNLDMCKDEVQEIYTIGK